MEYEIIKQLLDKYWEANTSLEEEKMLADYFKSGNVHPNLLVYCQLFSYYDEQYQVSLPEDFDKKVLQRIEEQKSAPVIRKMNSIWLRVAAAVIILITAAGIYKNINHLEIASQRTASYQVIAMKDTYQDPQQALIAVQNALMEVSKNMNKGQKIAQEKLTELDKLNKVIK
jgi:hypothetical protein